MKENFKQENKGIFKLPNEEIFLTSKRRIIENKQRFFKASRLNKVSI